MSKKLVSALRQYRHNNSDELVTAYDKEEADEVFMQLIDENTELKLKIIKLNLSLCEKLISAEFIEVTDSGTSIFRRQTGERFIYNGQFRNRNEGDKAVITVNSHGYVESVQFE